MTIKLNCAQFIKAEIPVGHLPWISLTTKMLPYNVFDVGALHSCWEVEEGPGIIAFSTRENHVFRGASDVADLVATIERGRKRQWKITMIESGIIIPFKIQNESVFEFEYRKTEYTWRREESRNWNLTDSMDVLIAQFDKCRIALTKVGKLYFTGKGEWLEHEIIVATIRAVNMYLNDI